MKASAGNRVLMLVENCPYPQDARVRHEAATLTRAGYEVAVIAQRSKRQLWRETVNDVRVYRYPAPPEGQGFLAYILEYGYSIVAAFVLSLVALIDHGFDVVHAHNPPDLFVFIGIFYKLFGKRFVYDHHDLAPEMYQALNDDDGNATVHRVLIQLQHLSCRMADCIIETNESYKKLDMERSGVPEERMVVVRNGPDLERLRPSSPDPQLREKAEHILGYVGDMGYHDGVDYLLRSLRFLVHELERTDVYCVIIGTGDAWQELQDLATQLELDEYVWFTGYVTDQELIRYLSSADICVDPDPANAFTDRSTMIKIMEYMALARPIVAFELTEHRVTAQGAALYAKPNCEEDFARKIVQLLDDPARRESMGRIGRRRAETQLAWKHQEQSLLSAYARLGLQPAPVLQQ